MKNYKKYLLIFIIVISIFVLLLFVNALTGNMIINNINVFFTNQLSTEPNQVSYRIYDASNIQNVKLVVKVSNNGGLEYIKKPDGSRINANGKSEIAFDFAINPADEMPTQFLVKANGREEETAEITVGKSVGPGERAEITIKNNYKDANDEKATIPAGWTVSGIESEQSIEDGLVIYDIPNGVTVDWTTTAGINSVREKYNQFVWVPVPDYSEFKRWGTSESNLVNDKIRDSSIVYYEPDASSTLYNVHNSAREDAFIEAKNMHASVQNYNGFYMGRYEASFESGKSTSKKNKAVDKSSGGNCLAVKSGGAMDRARAMYNSSAQNITSTLCYGVQWDAVLKWINKDPSLASIVTNSEGHGNYKVGDTSASKGRTGMYSIKNIYDMAGNVMEYTMETGYLSNSILRGGSYASKGSNAPIKDRFLLGENAGIFEEYVGYRVALYIK